MFFRHTVGLVLMTLTCLTWAKYEPVSGSYQKHYSSDKEQDHWLILGAIERVKGAMVAERDVRIKGKVSRWLWQSPVGFNSKDVFDHGRAALSKSAVTLFECEGRGCGLSNDFANQVFKQSILYGRETSQYYWVGLEQGDKDIVWLTYCIQRSNSRVYQYVEKIELAKGELASFQTDIKQAKMKELEQRGFLVLQELESGQKATLNDKNVEWLKSVLHKNSTVAYAVVVHRYNKKQEAGAVLMKAQNEAQEVVNQMAKANGFIQNLYAHGAGPMAPRVGLSDRIELVLIAK